MSNMASISKTVKKIIDRDASLKRELAKGLINKTELARHLKKEIGIKAKLDAYISAVRRYPIEKSNISKVESVLIGSKITIRNDRAILSLRKDREVQDVINKLAGNLKKYWGDSFKLIMGENSIKIIGDSKQLILIKDEIPSKKVFGFQDNQGELIISMKSHAQKIPGVGAFILNELALNRINISECLTCLPEMIFLFEERLTPNAYNVLYNLTVKQ